MEIRKYIDHTYYAYINYNGKRYAGVGYSHYSAVADCFYAISKSNI